MKKEKSWAVCWVKKKSFLGGNGFCDGLFNGFYWFAGMKTITPLKTILKAGMECSLHRGPGFDPWPYEFYWVSWAQAHALKNTQRRCLLSLL